MSDAVDLLVVRHGKAEDAHPMGDAARALTGDGRDEFREHARRVGKRVKLRGILTSPLVRAVQTAEILARACDVSQVLVRRELGVSAASTAGLVALAHEVGAGWALVGHNPSLAEFVSELLDQQVDLRKGATVGLQARGGVYRLIWASSPGRDFKPQIG